MNNALQVITQILSKLKDRTPEILDDQCYVEYAVLLPLMIKNGKLALLFEVRANQLKKQPGEICFPGGQMEKSDGSPRATALREASEELGIEQNRMEILGPLNVLWTPFQSKLHPYVALIKENTLLKPNNGEVQKTFEVPFDFLIRTKPIISHLDISTKPTDDFPFHLVPGGANYPWRKGKYPVYFYLYEDYIIWGLTARILHHFLTIIKEKDPEPN